MTGILNPSGTPYGVTRCSMVQEETFNFTGSDQTFQRPSSRVERVHVEMAGGGTQNANGLTLTETTIFFEVAGSPVASAPLTVQVGEAGGVPGGPATYPDGGPGGTGDGSNPDGNNGAGASVIIDDAGTPVLVAGGAGGSGGGRSEAGSAGSEGSFDGNDGGPLTKDGKGGVFQGSPGAGGQGPVDGGDGTGSGGAGASGDGSGLAGGGGGGGGQDAGGGGAAASNTGGSGGAGSTRNSPTKADIDSYTPASNTGNGFVTIEYREIPQPAENFTASNDGPAVNLTWDVTGEFSEDSWEIFRNGDLIRTLDVSQTSYTDSNPPGSSNVDYTIRGVNDRWGDSAEQTTSIQTNPGGFDTFDITPNVNNNEWDIIFSISETCDQAELYQSSDPGIDFSGTPVATTSYAGGGANGFFFRPFVYGERQYFRIRTVDANDQQVRVSYEQSVVQSPDPATQVTAFNIGPFDAEVGFFEPSSATGQFYTVQTKFQSEAADQYETVEEVTSTGALDSHVVQLTGLLTRADYDVRVLSAGPDASAVDTNPGGFKDYELDTLTPFNEPGGGVNLGVFATNVVGGDSVEVEFKCVPQSAGLNTVFVGPITAPEGENTETITNELLSGFEYEITAQSNDGVGRQGDTETIVVD